MARSALQLELALSARQWSEEALRTELCRLGASEVDRVAFRATRRRIWSLTRSARYGTALNLEPVFRTAPRDVIQALAVVSTGSRRRSQRVTSARRRIRDWYRTTGPAPPPPPRPIACAGTPEQSAFLRQVFEHLNRTRFDGCLPASTTLRFSSRMSRRLGQMREPGPRHRPPPVADASEPDASATVPSGADGLEIALALDLLVAGNEEAFLDTLLHEMAHAADFLSRGETDHGPHWRMWAARVGCAPRRCTTRPIARRRRGRRVTGVPPGHRRLAGTA